jgi:hypothetical protein
MVWYVSPERAVAFYEFNPFEYELTCLKTMQLPAIRAAGPTFPLSTP